MPRSRSVGVHDAFDDFLIGPENAALPEHGIYQRGFAVVHVGDDGDIANLFGHFSKSVFRQK